MVDYTKVAEVLVQNQAGSPDDIYKNIIYWLGNVAVLEEEDGGYEGAYYILYQRYKDDEFSRRYYGYLKIGWGSCEICDPVQACEGNPKDLGEFIKYLQASIMWLSKEDIIEALQKKDEEMEDCLSFGTYPKFREKTLKYFNK